MFLGRGNDSDTDEEQTSSHGSGFSMGITDANDEWSSDSHATRSSREELPSSKTDTDTCSTPAVPHVPPVVQPDTEVSEKEQTSSHGSGFSMGIKDADDEWPSDSHATGSSQEELPSSKTDTDTCSTPAVPHVPPVAQPATNLDGPDVVLEKTSAFLKSQAEVVVNSVDDPYNFLPQLSTIGVGESSTSLLPPRMNVLKPSPDQQCCLEARRKHLWSAASDSTRFDTEETQLSKRGKGADSCVYTQPASYCKFGASAQWIGRSQCHQSTPPVGVSKPVLAQQASAGS